ncbi:MAG: hypothetical protein IPN29_17290 [Saprospiraceae bacterium]|nr:hypothetical protein [Saprospiraceae bacterium]
MSKIPPTSKIYPAKLLLFGEYTALLGGDVLARPLSSHHATWAFGKSFPHPTLERQFDQALHKFPGLVFDREKWQIWLSDQGYLHSSVPVGYGLGSSGNLIAALFDAFFHFQPDHQTDLHELKGILGLLESYFHGSSSGVDPLVSYVNKTLLFSGGDIISPTHSSAFESQLKTIDSGHRRNTEALVNDFHDRLSDPHFAHAMEKLNEFNSLAIQQYLNEDAGFEATFFAISELQYEWMNHLITDNLKARWRKGLDTGSGLMKICGAGGGGYYLSYEL